MTLDMHNYSFCRCSVSGSSAPERSWSGEQAEPDVPATSPMVVQQRDAAGGRALSRTVVAMAGSSPSTLELWLVSDQVCSGYTLQNPVRHALQRVFSQKNRFCPSRVQGQSLPS